MSQEVSSVNLRAQPPLGKSTILIQGLEDAGVRGDVGPLAQSMEVLHLPRRKDLRVVREMFRISFIVQTLHTIQGARYERILWRRREEPVLHVEIRGVAVFRVLLGIHSWQTFESTVDIEKPDAGISLLDHHAQRSKE